MISEYIKSYDPGYGGWRKRSEAATFAAFLAGELKINQKGVTVDKDGTIYRVHIPLLSVYWSPVSTASEHWDRLLTNTTLRMKTWAT